MTTCGLRAGSLLRPDARALRDVGSSAQPQPRPTRSPWCYAPRVRAHTPRGQAFPEIHGEELVQWFLAQIDEERLGVALGVDLTPPASDPSHAPAVYGPLDAWLRRAEEVHAFLAARYRDEHREGGR